jgi:hypothetical protein
MLRCSSHASGAFPSISASLSPFGCRPSRIASTMSDAKQVSGREPACVGSGQGGRWSPSGSRSEADITNEPASPRPIFGAGRPICSRSAVSGSFHP